MRPWFCIVLSLVGGFAAAACGHEPTPAATIDGAPPNMDTGHRSDASVDDAPLEDATVPDSTGPAPGVRVLPPPADVTLRGVVQTAVAIVVVGEGGAAFRYAADTWTDFSKSGVGVSSETFSDLAITDDGRWLVAGGEQVVFVDADDAWATSVMVDNCAGWPVGVDVGADGTVVGACEYYTGLTTFTISDPSRPTHGPETALFQTRRVSVIDAANIAFLGGGGAAIGWRDAGAWGDAISWQEERLPGTGYNDLVLTTSGLVVVGSGGALVEGRRGELASAESPTDADLWAVDFAGGLTCAVGATGTVLTRVDGGAWSVQSGTPDVTLRAVAASDDGCVAVGDHGTVVALRL